MGIDQRVIDDVSRASDIVQVISNYLTLKRAGANYKALCPFHQEKTPSFMVSPHKQIYHCFGCGAGGNVFSFLMQHEHMTFPETIRHLAEKAGIHIPEERFTSPKDVSRARMMHDMYSAASEYYRAQYVDTERGKRAQAYLQKRGFSPDMVQFFGIGYASDTWDGLFHHLRKKDFSVEDILSSGLVIRSSKGTPMDFFRGRLIFPIHNIKDKVVAFGGRTLTQEEPKYINTPETEIFRKRFELYGLTWARRECQRSDSTCIVVEGYLDVIRLFQVGIKNAVAPLGTALTHDHARLLKRYAEKVLVIFDSDPAGITAALRTLTIFLEESVCVEVVTLPRGYDPDSLVSEKGREAFLQELTSAHDVFDFKLDYLLRTYDKADSLGLIKITNEMFDMLAVVKNTVLKDRYIKKLATRLGIREDSLRAELSGRKRVFTDETRDVHDTRKAPKQKYLEELNVLNIVLTDISLADMVFSSLSAEDFERDDAREIFNHMGTMLEEAGVSIDYRTLINRIHNEDTKRTLSELPFLSIEEENKEEALVRRICEMKLRSYDRQLKQIHEHIREAELHNDEEALRHYQQIKIDLQHAIRDIKTRGLMV